MAYKKSNVNGQATMANSEPVVNASDQIYKSVSFTTGAVAAVGTTDVSLYKSVSVHIVTQGTSSTITFQGSNDNTNWVSVALAQPLNTLSSPSTSTTSASVIFAGAISYQYFRLNVTGISAGTTAGVILFSAQSNPSVSTVAGQVSLNGTQSNNVAQIAGNTTATGNGASSTGVIRVAQVNDGTGVLATVGAVTSITNALPAGTNNIGDVDVLTMPATYAEDAAHTTGDLGVAILAKRTDTAASSAGTDGDYATLNTDNTGRLWARIGATDSLTPGTAAANLGKAEDAAHTTGDVGVMALTVRNDSEAALSGTDLDYTPIATDSLGSVRIIGERAHDAVDAGKPIKTGGQARTTNPTAVSDADRCNFITDKLGKQVVVGSIRDLKGNQNTTITSSTSETTIVTAVASTFLDLYGLVLTNTSASATEVTIKDATAGTTRFSFMVPAGDTRGFMLPESAAHKQATVNNNWTATCGTSVASLKVTALYVSNI